jgi:hypothetical protein
VKKTRQDKELEPGSDSIRTERASRQSAEGWIFVTGNSPWLMPVA